MTRPYYEIVTYTVADADEADAVRAATLEILQGFPGFIAWTAFSGTENPAMRVDLASWRSREDALAAARAVASELRFAGFRASITGIVSMDYYAALPGEAHPVVAGDGIELGRFRLKPGVSEDEMRQAYTAMVSRHLAGQAGWLRQHLVRLDNGMFVDLAFADGRVRAEAICASWLGQPACEAFLALIEPESMEFGTVL